MYDILIKNGKIVDGSGAPWFYGDVAIEDQRIARIAPEINQPALQIIDAAGKYVCPGFIDSHSHSDLPLLINPLACSKIRMGVTTEVIGQCGTSAAPRRPGQRDFFGYNLTDLGVNFESFAEYLGVLRNRGTAINVVPLVGHGNIRALIMGEEDRQPTVEEMSAMKTTLAESLKAGAFGMTTGLIYPPGCFSEIAELIELSHTLHKHQGFYATHMRNEKHDLIKSIKETIEIGKTAKVPVHISHFKVCDERNWGLVKEGLKLIEEAREAGVDVTMDQYPYIASSTSLVTLIPQWAHDGGADSIRQRLGNPVIRAEIRAEMLDPIIGTPRYDHVMVTSCLKEENKQYEGLNLVEIGELMGLEPVDACLELLLDENFTPGMVRFSMCEEDVKTVMQHPLVMIGSDASAMATEGLLSTGKPHPRAYGTFTRVLGKYVLAEHVLTFEQAIYKMSGLPASRLLLQDRGLLRQNFFADITIVNPADVIDKATFKHPHQYAAGIDAVIVNGCLVLEDGQQSQTLFPGKVLKRN